MEFQEFSKTYRIYKYLEYINGTIIWTFFIPLFPVSPVIFGLYSNEALLG